jgi:Cu(I)/Ag(I) efflux system membrane fusion protein
MKKNIILIILAVVTIGIFYAAYHFVTNSESVKSTSGNKELYICPMHPEIQSNHPGVCPICNMDLVLKENAGVSSDSVEDTSKLMQTGDVMLSPSQQVMANVQTEKVKIREFKYDMTFDGYIKAPDDNMRNISTPVAGRIVKMYLNYEGQAVTNGMKVFDIYSPEIYSAQKEYLLALRNYESVKNSEYEIVKEQAKDLLNSARTRLSLWEVTADQVSELEASGEVKNFITIRSKYNGIVTRKIVNEGQWIMAGESVYELVDVRTLWIIANVPESDLSFIKIGQTGEISAVSYQEEVFLGTVRFISPVMNPETRTIEVRLDVVNKEYRLKPDMYVRVSLKSLRNEWNIVVPRSAVLRTGKEDLVYLKIKDNVFSPRKISIGGEKDELYLITSGLSEGDEIVTSGGFLIDSESRIRMGSSSNTTKPLDSKRANDEILNNEKDIMKDLNEHKH